LGAADDGRFRASSLVGQGYREYWSDITRDHGAAAAHTPTDDHRSPTMTSNRRTRLTIAAALGLPVAIAVLGCDNRNTPNDTSVTGTGTTGRGSTTGTTGRSDTATPAGRSTSPTNPPPSATQPDNSGRNAADRGTTAPTPLDQGENATDRRITADIRKAVMGESGMSTNGQNCKIITKDGVVTLRGPVDSQAEKDAIEAKARAVAGVTSVVNELEVKTK